MPVNGISVLVDFLIFDIRRSAARIGVRSQAAAPPALALRIWLMQSLFRQNWSALQFLGLVVRANSERLRRCEVSAAGCDGCMDCTGCAAGSNWSLFWLIGWVLDDGELGRKSRRCLWLLCHGRRLLQHQGNGYDRG